MTGFDVAGAFTTRHAIRGSGSVMLRPQVDKSTTFTVRHAIRGAGSVTIAADVSASFTHRHAVQGRATVAVVGANVSGSLTVRHEVAGGGTVDVGRGVVDISASFTTRHAVQGSGRIEVSGTNEAGTEGVRVEFDGVESPHVQQNSLEISNKISVLNTAEMQLKLGAEDIDDVPARGTLCEIYDHQTNRLLLAGTVDEPAVAFVSGGQLVVADLFIAGHDARLNDRLLTQDEGISVAEQTTAQRQAETIIDTLSGEGFTHNVTLPRASLNDDFRFTSPRKAFKRSR